MSKGSGGRQWIDRESIVLQAVRTVRDEGLAALTVRNLADRLGVTAAALYRHVRDKDELLTLVADAVFSEIEIPSATDGDWAYRLELIARRGRDVLSGYPGLGLYALKSTRTFPAPHAQRIADAALGLMAEGGFDAETSAVALRALRYFSSVGLPPDRQKTALKAGNATDVDNSTPDPTSEELEASFNFGLRCLMFALRELAEHGPARLEPSAQTQ